MDTVRRVLGAYLSGPVGEIAGSSPASSVKSLVPRRLSFARASSTSASDGVARATNGNQASRAMSRFVRDAVGGKRARESSGTNGEGANGDVDGGGDDDGAGGKRPRHDDDVDVAVVRGEISGRGDEVLAPWPSAKRKRGIEDEEDAETPAAHRRRTSERASVQAPRARATPVLVAEKVLKGGRLDGFKALPKMSSRVAAPARRGPTNRRGLGGRRRIVDVRARVEFDELAEDKAERERLEATRAPALGLPSSYATTVASDRPKSNDSGGLGAALAEFKSTAATAAAEPAKPTTTSNPPSSTGGFTFTAAPPSSSTANPFSKPPTVGAPSATPFAFSAGAAADPAPGRRVVRARRPASRNR